MARLRSSSMLLGGFLHRLSTNLLGRKAKSMECNTTSKIEILDLDGYAPKFVHELSEGLVACLSQTGQGDRGHAMRPAGSALWTESFDKGVEAVYEPRWESTVPGQCCSLEGCREDTT